MEIKLATPQDIDAWLMLVEKVRDWPLTTSDAADDTRCVDLAC